MGEARRKVVIREFDDYIDSFNSIVPNVTRLLEAVRETGLGVVYSCLGYQAGEGPSALQVATGWLWNLDTSDGAFPDNWRPRVGEPVFTKAGWGAVANPALAQFLREAGVENVVIAGTMFEFGIRQTCYELSDRGIGCLVVSDAVASITPAAHTHTAGDIAHGLTKLRSTAELLDLLPSLAQKGSVLI